jgi:Holliday junction DNA helicase RuvA
VIGWLRGVLRDRESGQVVVDVQGVGYVVRVPASTLLELPKDGATVELLVSTLVREDAITLHGFRTREERDLFDRLLTVSGVGPRTSLAALSALGPDDLARAIASGDSRRLASVPGIGRKTAERIVIDLRDKVAPAGGGAARPAGPEDDVRSALVNLGYPEKAAGKALEQAREAGHATFEALLKDSLSRLGRG